MSESAESEVLWEFVGRNNFLQELLSQWNKFRIFAVLGLKSVGKSRTVEEFLSNTLKHPDPDTVKYVNIDLRTVRTEQSFLFQIKSAFTISSEELDDDVYNVAEDILRNMKKDERIIVNFDNAEDVIESPAKDLFVTICETLIEHTTCVRIVFTSTVVVDFPGQKENYYTKELPLLSHSDGVALLCSVTPNVKYTSTLDKIVDLCLGLPLAILMTGRELEMDSGYLSPGEMVEILTSSPMDALENGNHVQTCTRLKAWSRDCSYAKQEQIGHVYSNFIRRLSEVFRKRLAVLGYIPGTFTTGQAQQLLGDTSIQSFTEGTLVTLSDRHMVEFDPRRRRYNIHGVLKDCLEVYFTIENLPDVRKRYCRNFCERVQELCCMLFVTKFLDAVSDLALEYTNVQKLLILVKYSGPDIFPFYIQMVQSSAELIEQYFGDDCFKFYAQLLELCEKYDKPKADAVVSRAYGSVLTNIKGYFIAGEIMYRRAHQYLSIDPSSLDIATFICQNLGWNLYQQGRLIEALHFLQKALMYQNQLGMKLEWVALATLTTIGLVHVGMGNFDDGERYQMESIRRRIEKHGEIHPHIGSMYNNLGELYVQRGDHEKASYYFRRGLEIKRQTNARPYIIIVSLTNVASLEIRNKRFAEAKELLDEARSLLQQNMMGSSLLEVETLETYGKYHLAKGDYIDAITILERVTKRKKTSCCGGIGHVESLLYLGRAHSRGGNPSMALQVIREALSHKDDVAREAPQNTVIWECLVEMVDIQEQQSSSKEHHHRDLLQVFSDGEKELSRIKRHCKEKGLSFKVDAFDKKLKAWKQRFENSQNTNIRFLIWIGFWLVIGSGLALFISLMIRFWM